MKGRITKLTSALVSTVVASAFIAPSVAMAAELKGNIGVFSKYVLRGITNNTENDGTTVQGGLDYVHDNGVYVGYWGSNLDYGNATTTVDGLTLADHTHVQSGTATGFENDFYAGYATKVGSFSVDVGAIQYVYVEVEDSNGTEVVGKLGYGPVTAGLKYLVNDVAWGNSGDIYWTVAYSTTLPKDFSLGATAGFYTYNDDDAGNDKKTWTTTTEDSGFRHLDLSLSHAIGQSGANMSITYVVGGKDRLGTDNDNAVVLGVAYGFNI